MAQVRPQLRGAQQDTDRFIGAISKSTHTNRDFSRGVFAASLSVAGLRGAVLAAGSSFLVGAGLIRGMELFLGLSAQFERSLNTLQAVTHATAGEMRDVSEEAIKLGNDFTLPKTSAADAAESMTELARGGLDVRESMAAARGSLQLASAAGTSFAEAAQIQARAIQAFDLGGRDAVRVADALANSANVSTGEITDMALALRQSAAVAHQAGLSLEDTATAVSILANAGLTGSDAGTSLRTMLLRLNPVSKKAREEMERLKITIFDASGNFLPFEQILENYRRVLGKLTPEQRQLTLQTIFGQDAIRSSTILTAEGAKGFNEMRKQIERQGAAAALAAAKNRGLAGTFDALQSNAETIAINLGKRALPGLTDFVKGVNSSLTSLSQSRDAANALSTAGETLHGILTGVGDVAKVVAPPLILMARAIVKVTDAVGGRTILGAVVAYKAFRIASDLVEKSQRRLASATGLARGQFVLVRNEEGKWVTQQSALAASQARLAASEQSVAAATSRSAAASIQATSATSAIGAARLRAAQATVGVAAAERNLATLQAAVPQAVARVTAAENALVAARAQQQTIGRTAGAAGVATAQKQLAEAQLALRVAQIDLGLAPQAIALQRVRATQANEYVAILARQTGAQQAVVGSTEAVAAALTGQVAAEAEAIQETEAFALANTRLTKTALDSARAAEIEAAAFREVAAAAAAGTTAGFGGTLLRGGKRDFAAEDARAISQGKDAAAALERQLVADQLAASGLGLSFRNLGRSALAFVGGPMGAVTLGIFAGITALTLFGSRGKSAIDTLKDSTDELARSMENVVSAQAALGQARTQVPTAKTSLEEAKLNVEYAKGELLAAQASGESLRLRTARVQLKRSTEQLQQATRDLATAQADEVEASEKARGAAFKLHKTRQTAIDDIVATGKAMEETARSGSGFLGRINKYANDISGAITAVAPGLAALNIAVVPQAARIHASSRALQENIRLLHEEANTRRENDPVLAHQLDLLAELEEQFRRFPTQKEISLILHTKLATGDDSAVDQARKVVDDVQKEVDRLSDQLGGRAVVLPGPNTGLLSPGNLDLLHRKIAQVGQDIATVRTVSIATPRGEVLLPTVIEGKIVSLQKAIEHFRKTGEDLGTFASVAAANAYAQRLHLQQQRLFGEAKGRADKIAKPTSVEQRDIIISDQLSAARARLAKATQELVSAERAASGLVLVGGRLLGQIAPSLKQGQEAIGDAVHNLASEAADIAAIDGKRIGTTMARKLAEGIVTEESKTVATLRASLARTIAEGEAQIQESILSAKSNLISIGGGLSEQIAQLIDQGPLGQRIARLQAQLATAQTRDERTRLKQDLADAKRELEAQRERLDPTLSRGLTPAQRRARERDIEAFLGPLQRRVRDAQRAINEFNTQQVISKLQQTQEQQKDVVKKGIQDIIAAFVAGRIPAGQAVAGIASYVRKFAPNFNKSGNALGLSFKLGFQAQLDALNKEIAALAAPGVRARDRTGFPGPTVERPSETIAQVRLDIIKAQNDLKDATKLQTKAVHANTQAVLKLLRQGVAPRQAQRRVQKQQGQGPGTR